MTKSRIMYTMTVPEVREALKVMKTVIVPIGVVEQHGYHLPLCTDIVHAQELARLASEATGCFVAPPVHYSFSGGTLPGTINISPETVAQVLKDILASLADQGFQNMILLLGHCGSENTQAAKTAAENFLKMHPLGAKTNVLVVPFFLLSATYQGAFDEGDYHAGRYETSMMLHWRPEWVHMDRAVLDAPEDLKRAAEEGKPQAPGGLAGKYAIPRMKYPPSIKVGVSGDFHGSNEEFGKVLIDETVAALVTMVNELEAGRA